MTTIKHREPVYYFHTAATVITVLATLVVNAVGNLPADANWTIAGLVVVRTVIAYLTRGHVFSPESVAAILGRLGVPVTNVDKLLSGDVPARFPGTGTASPEDPNASA
jgi:hypothetical protein